MERFAHNTLAQRVVVGTGTIVGDLLDEVARLSLGRVLLIGENRPDGPAAEIDAALHPVAWLTSIEQHVPADLATRARETATESAADGIVAVGGGSSIGLAKIIALSHGIPIIAVPTTFAGSEATDVWGITEDGHKKTGHDLRVLPRTVVYDTTLTATLPAFMIAASGMNSVAHAIDTLWAPSADPINGALALEALRALNTGLRAIVAGDAADADRMEATTGTYLAGAAFASAGSGLHHKICHVLGGTFGYPHAPTHAVVLPYVLALNGPLVPDTTRRIADVLGTGTALGGLIALGAALDAPRALRDIGPVFDHAAAADIILGEAPPSNPRRLTRDLLIELLDLAWQGGDAEELERNAR
ncbi:maleylacetate reductase [Lacisediminihabitans profunda]|uniref:Maleylacetate reductase n=1 Tax=Lacisediminihabitans profunda TaxID=2594790 RepID=A0A5C8UM37_9MICO|nr:maleylacetate reductase [Lacisediminihabitans profunda]TXN28350.1 maleylacetate reductase [Lacisediminihabitans profunda]